MRQWSRWSAAESSRRGRRHTGPLGATVSDRRVDVSTRLIVSARRPPGRTGWLGGGGSQGRALAPWVGEVVELIGAHTTLDLVREGEEPGHPQNTEGETVWCTRG